MNLSVVDVVGKRHRALVEAIKQGVGGDGAALLDHLAFPTTDHQGQPVLGMGQAQAAEPNLADDSDYSIPFTISTYQEDRDGDLVVPMGCHLDNYKLNPVIFFGHQQNPVPIGVARNKQGLCTVYPEENRLRSVAFFDHEDEDAMFIHGKVKRGILSAASIAFVPIMAERREFREKAELHNHPLMPPGWLFKAYDLTEWSVVGVPANAGAIRDSLDKEKSFISPRLQKALKLYCATAKGCWLGWCPPCDEQETGVMTPNEMRALKGRKPYKGNGTDPVIQPGQVVPLPFSIKPYDPGRWNKSLSANFEVDQAELPASNMTYDFVSKYLGCEVKHVFNISTFVPSARMGTFLTGLKRALSEYDVVDVRNIRGGRESRDSGSEAPPVYEAIQLNSKQSDTFLVNGAQFLREGRRVHGKHIRKAAASVAEGRKFVLEYSPDYGGIGITGYVKQTDAPLLKGIIDGTWDWAKQNNFLKGEAFALSGEFLGHTDEDWSDIFIEKRNEKVLKRVLGLFNDKQKGFANRGIIFCGPPGTGKTLSGRILRNQAKGTFIWVSSRDFHKAGSFGGIRFAFELARELSPSIVFIEDVDNWMNDHTVDLMKTEMDGISRSKGVWTVLTTNFPEQMPEALIDRPGRFHDVLDFGLPAPEARKSMLSKWLPDIPEDSIQVAVGKTNGYSGAHVYELAQFALTLNEHDGMEPTEALTEALTKIDEQRQLINQLQLRGSNYKYDPKRRTLKTGKSLNGAVVKDCGCKDENPEHECECDKCKAKREKAGTQADMETGGVDIPDEDEEEARKPGNEKGSFSYGRGGDDEHGQGLARPREGVWSVNSRDPSCSSAWDKHTFYSQEERDRYIQNLIREHQQPLEIQIQDPGDSGWKWKMKKEQPSSDISPDKACQILHDGEANGKPLTEAQRGMFGAACGSKKLLKVRVEKGKRLLDSYKTIAYEKLARGHKAYLLKQQKKSGLANYLCVIITAKGNVTLLRQKACISPKVAVKAFGLRQLLQGKALNENSGTAGGYIVPPDENEDETMNKKPKTKQPHTPPFETGSGVGTYQTPGGEQATTGQKKPAGGAEATSTGEKKPAGGAEATAIPKGAGMYAHAHNHLKALDDWITDNIGDHEPEVQEHYSDLHQGVKDLMQAHADKFSERYPEHDIAKVLEPEGAGGDTDLEGEAGEVNEGDIPETEEGADDAAEATDEITGGDEGGDEEVKDENEAIEGEAPANDLTDEGETDEGETGEDEDAVEPEDVVSKDDDLGIPAGTPTEEILTRYRQPTGSSETEPQKKNLKSAGCTKDHFQAVSRAGDYLYKMSEHKEIPTIHRGAMRHHSDQLANVLKDIEGGGPTSPNGKVPEVSKVRKGLNGNGQLSQETMKALVERLEKLGDTASKVGLRV